MKKIIKYVLMLFAGFLVFLTGQTAAETIAVKRKINNFKQLGVYQEEISNDNVKYYKVSRETLGFEEVFKHDPFYGENNYTNPGSEGDIFVTRQSPFPFYPGIHQFISFYFGGHAAYLDDNNRVYEVAGIPDLEEGETFLNVFFKGNDSTTVYSTGNYWFDDDRRDEDDDSYSYYGSYYRKEWVGLRVKGVSQEEVKLVTAEMQRLEEMEAQYNFQFIFNRKDRYYCTDLMSRAYETIINNNSLKKVNLNRDGVAVTVNDLILSKDVYLAYYVWTDKNDVKHVYFIDD